ncbi:MAG: hypothetical protein QXU74_01060 [Candidatus Aenigmatarchaeota archaeon]
MPKKVKKEDLMKEMEDVKNLISHLEEEYRKTNISEKNYQELMGKYSKKLEEIKGRLGIKEEMVVEKPVEGKKEAAKVEEVKEEKEDETEKEEKAKGGFFSRLFKKKEKEVKQEQEEVKPENVEGDVPEVGEIEEMTPEVIEKLAQQVAAQAGVKESKTEVEEVSEEKGETPASVEIEKLKVMIDTVREANRAVEESIRNISESIGELRSMIFQVEGSTKEIALKFEKIEDELAEIRPKEIEKKFRDINTNVDKQQMLLEKLDKKSEDLAEKINKVFEIMKGIGNVENLINLNSEIQKKTEEIKEAIKYIERIAMKTEKAYIDLSKSLEDFVIYKTRQEGLEEISRDILKSIDEMNVKFEGYVTKKDLEKFQEDLILIQKQIQEINKVLPMVEVKLPETIVNLRRERDDVIAFLNYLEEQFKAKKISKEEYEKIKETNKKKLEKIEKELRKEWEKIEKWIKPKEGVELSVAVEKPPEEKKEVVQEEKSEIKPESEKTEEVAEVEKQEEVKEEKDEEQVDKNVEAKRETGAEEKKEVKKKKITKTEAKPAEEVKTEEKIEEVEKEKLAEEEAKIVKEDRGEVKKPKKEVMTKKESKKKEKKIVKKKEKVRVKKEEGKVLRKKKILEQLKKGI